jgi:hypothetical protein
MGVAYFLQLIKVKKDSPGGYPFYSFFSYVIFSKTEELYCYVSTNTTNTAATAMNPSVIAMINPNSFSPAFFSS